MEMNMRVTFRVIFLLLLLAALPASAESLYRDESFQSLTADRRAYRVGDALTVLVVENSSAASSADTTTEKRGGVGVAVTTQSDEKRGNIDLTETFGGKGKIQRTGRLLATLTVSVTAIAPNGDLIVTGSQLIEVNEEKQHIQLEGRVRPVDVTETNTVLSSRIAEAKIAYVGAGLLGEKQRPGILTRFLSWLRIL
jgi:flagellar L-ring protein precursor FlgH